jgi:hypothetical protein
MQTLPTCPLNRFIIVYTRPVLWKKAPRRVKVVKKRNSRGIAFLVFFCCFQIACLFSIPQPAATPTADPQATATAVAAINAVSELTKDWRTVLKERFDSNKNYLWYTFDTDDELAKTIVEVKDGAYIWELTAHDEFFEWVGSRVRTVSSFHLSVDAHMTIGENGEYGVIFRENDKDFYVFRMVDAQFFGVSKNIDDEWTTILDLTESGAIKPYQVNRISIMGQRTHFYFFINDQFVAEVEDDSIPYGGIGFYVSLCEKGDKAVIEFDNVIMLAP